MDKAIETANAATNTNTFNQIGIINTDKKKQKPHNITFKNFNPNEPKTRKSKILYSDKQNYRRYKTKTEPQLFSKIMVDDEEDLIAQIRKEFGIEDKTRKNYSEVETSGTPYYEEPKPVLAKFDDNELTDISRNEIEDILGELITTIENRFKFGDVADEDLLPFDDDEEEEGEVNEELLTLITIDVLNEMSEKELEQITKDLDKIALKYSFAYSGKKPKKPEGILKRAQDIRNEIALIDKTAETSEVVGKK